MFSAPLNGRGRENPGGEAQPARIPGARPLAPPNSMVKATKDWLDRTESIAVTHPFPFRTLEETPRTGFSDQCDACVRYLDGGELRCVGGQVSTFEWSRTTKKAQEDSAWFRARPPCPCTLHHCASPPRHRRLELWPGCQPERGKPNRRGEPTRYRDVLKRRLARSAGTGRYAALSYVACAKFPDRDRLGLADG